jgi:hypothetical protein
MAQLERVPQPGSARKKTDFVLRSRLPGGFFCGHGPSDPVRKSTGARNRRDHQI